MRIPEHGIPDAVKAVSAGGFQSILFIWKSLPTVGFKSNREGIVFVEGTAV